MVPHYRLHCLRSSILWALSCLLLPAIASAVPDPVTSITPDTIRIVTPRQGGPDPSAVYTAIIFDDLTGLPLPGETVTLDFSGCTHVQPASEQAFPGMTVASCAPPVLSATTNAFGAASFLVMGSVVSRSDPASNAGCVAVFAGAPPVLMGFVSPSAYDQDGVNGLTANDLSLMVCDLASAPPALVRSDLNGDGSLGGADLAFWIDQYFRADGTSRTPVRCDGGATTTTENPPGGALRLAWTSCASDGGTQTRASACASNVGAEVLVASFVAPPGVEALTGFEAEVVVAGDVGEALASWWRLDPAGCRNTSLSVSLSADPGVECPPVDEAVAIASRAQYPYPNPGSTFQLIRVVGTFPPGIVLTAGQEYTIFRLRVNRSKTTGTGSCAGCGENVAVLFRWLKLTQPATDAGGCSSPPAPSLTPQALSGDFIIRADLGLSDWYAYWQGTPAGFPGWVDAPAPRTAPAVRLTCSNPSRATGRVELAVPRAMRCRLALFDLAGRRLRVLLDEVVPGGARTLAWDGRDDAGQPLASGYYVLRLVTEEGTLSRPLIHLN